jgi:acyl-CoA thioester hydrolase
MAATTTSLRVRYAETDRMGVVYYANYFVWFEVARADWLRAHGWTYRDMEDSGVLLPVIEAHCEYRRPARYDDEIDVVAEAQLASLARLAFTYDVRVRGQAAPVATGRTVHAAVTREGRPCRLPDRVRQVLP